jgi:hypothetical protein
MLSSIRNTTALDGLAAAAAAHPPGPVRQASRDLAQALRRDDLDAARQAYVSLAKAMPDDAKLEPGAPFAALGKALVQGDVAAARAAAAEVFPHRVVGAGARGAPAVPTPVVSVPSSTGGAAGGQLNTVA